MSTATILNLASRQLQDVTGRTWDQTTVLIPYLNLAVKEIINLKPDANPVTRTFALVAGAIQSIPATSLNLLDAVCNMGVGGATPGKSIVALDKEQMDDIYPDWMTYTANSVVQFVIPDLRDPKHFYVFPPQPATPSQIKGIFSEYPTALAATTETFPLDDSYEPAAVDYTIYRALIEETTVPNAVNKANVFFGKFMQDLGLKIQVEKQLEDKGK